MTNENRVRHNKQTQQFEMALEEGKTAFIQYEEESEGILALAHTEVPEEYEGQGIGSALLKGAFQILQAENLKIVPTCPFVAAYVRRHPEYQSLVA